MRCWPDASVVVLSNVVLLSARAYSSGSRARRSWSRDTEGERSKRLFLPLCITSSCLTCWALRCADLERAPFAPLLPM